jgi:hypothetical protein
MPTSGAKGFPREVGPRLPTGLQVLGTVPSPVLPAGDSGASSAPTMSAKLGYEILGAINWLHCSFGHRLPNSPGTVMFSCSGPSEIWVMPSLLCQTLLSSALPVSQVTEQRTFLHCFVFGK